MIHGRIEWSGDGPTVVRHVLVCPGKPDERSVQLRLSQPHYRTREPLDLRIAVGDVEGLIAELRLAQAWVATGEES